MTTQTHLLHRCTTLAFTAGVLAGCASPAPNYYTLAPGQTSNAASINLHSSSMYIEVAAVRVPERLNRTQILASEGEGILTLLENERWSAVFPEELRDALSQHLQDRLGASDLYHQRLSGLAPVYRVSVDVVRMDAKIEGLCSAIINWKVQVLPGNNILSGQTRAELQAIGGVAGIVHTYQQMVATASIDITAAIDAMRQEEAK